MRNKQKIKYLNKYCLCVITTLLFLGFISINNGNAQSESSIKMIFKYKNQSNEVVDTVVSRQKFRYWSRQESFPDYVQWKDQPFSIQLSPIEGVGLFTDSLTSYSTNQNIGFGFVKKGSSGKFIFDYIETKLVSFINHSTHPNLSPEITETGIILKANQTIDANSELTVNYQHILDLFPNDKTISMKIVVPN